MKLFYYIPATLFTGLGIFTIFDSLAEPGFDIFMVAQLILIIGQLGFIQGNQQ